MKKNSFLSGLSGILLFAVISAFPSEFATGAVSGLSVCGKILIPSLFPFLIAAALTGSASLPSFIKKMLNPVSSFLFGLPADCFPAIALGQLGGYLSGAKASQALCSSGIISPLQAERLLLFCINAGTGFSVNAIGNGMLASREAGRVLLFSLCVSSVLLGFAGRFFAEKDSVCTENPKLVSIPFSVAVVNSVSSGAAAMLSSCSFVVIFSAVCSVIGRLIRNQSVRIALICLLEVTNGCAELSSKGSLPAIAAVCAFGGLCVHMQIFAVAGKINMPRFYLFRLLHSVLAYIICKTTLHFHPVALPACVELYSNAQPFSFSAPAAISLLFLCALLILDLDNSREIC